MFGGRAKKAQNKLFGYITTTAGMGSTFINILSNLCFFPIVSGKNNDKIIIIMEVFWWIILKLCPMDFGSPVDKLPCIFVLILF